MTPRRVPDRPNSGIPEQKGSWGEVVLIGTIALVIIVAGAVKAFAVAPEWYPVARWEMNEYKDATVLRDTTGNGHQGMIGRRVTTNSKYHAFPREPRDKVYPGHVDSIPDTDTLDPGTGDFAVTVRFQWSSKRHDMNLVQKGQGSPDGGIVKVKTTVPSQGQPPGHIKCLFRGSTGDSQVESYAGKVLNDGKWHTVRCTRTDTGTAMFVDGSLIDTNTNQPGAITNDWPVAIGGNTYCEDTATENNICNYWHGKIGFVRWSRT